MQVSRFTIRIPAAVLEPRAHTESSKLVEGKSLVVVSLAALGGFSYVKLFRLSVRYTRLLRCRFAALIASFLVLPSVIRRLM
jgi:hypothetical protein